MRKTPSHHLQSLLDLVDEQYYKILVWELFAKGRIKGEKEKEDNIGVDVL
jgi:hypothetical protein